MNLVLKSLSALTLSLTAAATFAFPANLVTHNESDLESNAFIAGYIPSPYPTAAYSTRDVSWNMVRIACYGHTTNGQCQALIKLGTNTEQPIELGYLTLNLSTGEINPKQISNGGYTLTVNGLAETTISKN